MDVVCIATYAKPEEAHLARLHLEAEGVPAFLADEHVVQMDWALTNAVGGVRLMVEEEHIEAAVKILELDPVSSEVHGLESMSCPKCQQCAAEPYQFARGMGAASVILSLPFLFFTRWHRWRCGACGHTWK